MCSSDLIRVGSTQAVRIDVRGAVMPSYGNAISARDAWSLVHYIRHMQKVSPR